MRSTVAVIGLAVWLMASPSASAVARVAPPAAPITSPLPQTALTQIDSAIADLFPKYTTWQDDYFAQHGLYFQALPTHSVTPKGDTAATPDRLNDGPTDQTAKNISFWDGVELPVKTPFAMQIDQYVAPDGPGHVLVVVVDVDGDIWQKQFNTGPEKWRDIDWRIIAPSVVISK